MDIKRVEGSYDMYRITATKGEMDVIRSSLTSASGAEADELLGAFDWYDQMLPGPGETKDDAKERMDGDDGGDKVPVAPGDADIEAEADRLISGEKDLPGGPEPEIPDDIESEADELLMPSGGEGPGADFEPPMPGIE